jgi:2-polyprenyl-3-methyl-5-hydroxy-6-metoxy-1,4-benzoquinol methylase
MNEIYWESRYTQKKYTHENIDLNCSILNHIQNFKEGSRILDHGCGNGRVCKELIKKNHFIYYNDISDASLSFLEKIFLEKNYLKTKKIQGCITRCEEKNFDHIISHRVLHSCENYLDIIKKFYEKLNGTLSLSVRSINCIEYNQKKSLINKENIMVAGDGKRTKFFTKIEIENILLANGFKIIEDGEFKELAARSKKPNSYLYFIVKK